MAKVPALVDGEVVVTETAAICLICDKFIEKGFAPPLIHPARSLLSLVLFLPQDLSNLHLL